jgi:hypothetical protein
MCRGAFTPITSPRRIAATATLLATACGVWGCGGGGPSTQQRIKEQLAETKSSDSPVAKFSGIVTIDGQTPSLPPRYAVLLILYSDKDAKPGHETIYRTVCDKEGHFEFTRYSKGDGVPPGTYTVLFEALMPRSGSRFTGADQLKNLYNDPDKSPFHVDITPPGKTDWDFNLEIAGKDPVSPGPRAVTRIH